MSRVGFVMNFTGSNWLGGVSYFRNLLAALARLPDPRIEPVFWACPNARCVGAITHSAKARNSQTAIPRNLPDV